MLNKLKKNLKKKKDVYLKSEWRFPDHQTLGESLTQDTKTKTIKKKNWTEYKQRESKESEKKVFENYSEISGDISAEKKYLDAMIQEIFRK